MFIQAKQEPADTIPPQPVNPISGSGPITFTAYNKWLGDIVNSIEGGEDLTSAAQFKTDSQAAYQELYNHSGVHYQCLNVPSCKDVDTQRAELQGLDLTSVGIAISKAFVNQSGDTKAAAIAYLRSKYSLPAA